MNRTVLAIQSKRRTDEGRFNLRDFGRMLALTWPFRAYLIPGVLLTVVFAVLHTVSLGAAFPVFKILLEEEGLHGWADRMIAGERLGMDLAPPSAKEEVRVVGIKKEGRAASAGVEENDVLADARGRPVAEFLRELADAETDVPITLAIQRGGERLTLEVLPEACGTIIALLGRIRSLIPADSDTASGKLRMLGYILAGVLVVVLAANTFRFFGEVLIAQAVLRGLMALRARLYERTLHLPVLFFAGQPTADIVGRFVQDMQEVQRGLLTLFGRFLREPLRALLMLGFALSLDWRLTLALLVVVPITVVVFWAVGRSVKKANIKLLRGYGRMIDTLTTSLHNLRVVKAYTAEEHEQARLTRVDLKMFRQQLKLARLQAMVSPAMETLAVVAGSMMTLWLASQVLARDIEVSRFVMLGLVLAYLFDPVRKLTDVYVRVLRSTAGMERIFQVLDQPTEMEATAGDVELKPLEDEIEYAHVSFTYPGARTPAVTDATLTIRKGETMALVGPNGCGKTTLVSLLARFFDPQSGEIRYDGLDIRRATLPSLRKQMGLVTQDTVIFAGTPVENIAYGVSQTNGKAVQDAARRASADEFIRNLPGGYEADLGERGNTLSGGQRQRLAIARAIFRNAPILIFDEATSQIDTESELQIQRALREFSKDRTTIIIAHRLSTIQFADRIVVMNAGRIIDSGTHSQLFDRCSLYRSLCETQFVSEPASSGGE